VSRARRPRRLWPRLQEFVTVQPTRGQKREAREGVLQATESPVTRRHRQGLWIILHAIPAPLTAARTSLHPAVLSTERTLCESNTDNTSVTDTSVNTTSSAHDQPSYSPTWLQLTTALRHCLQPFISKGTVIFTDTDQHDHGTDKVTDTVNAAWASATSARATCASAAAASAQSATATLAVQTPAAIDKLPAHVDSACIPPAATAAAASTAAAPALLATLGGSVPNTASARTLPLAKAAAASMAPG
jgi:hypothetical protein